jgi:hypothetical protein
LKREHFLFVFSSLTANIYSFFFQFIANFFPAHALQTSLRKQKLNEVLLHIKCEIVDIPDNVPNEVTAYSAAALILDCKMIVLLLSHSACNKVFKLGR